MSAITDNTNSLIQTEAIPRLHTGTLKGHRVTAELKQLHRASQRKIFLKSVLAGALLITSVALIALFHISSMFFATGLGLLILSTYLLLHYGSQQKHLNKLFKRAQKALHQLM